MRRLAAIIVVLVILASAACAGCAHRSLLPPVAVSQCPGGLSADLQDQPQPAAGAGMVRAETTAESDAQAATLTWIHDLAAWGRAGWGRAADARDFCARLTTPSTPR